MDLTNNTPQIEVDASTPESGDTATPETVDNGTPEEPEQEDPVFTQKELDAKIGERLAKEKRKWERQQADKAAAPRPMAEPKPADFATPAEFIDAAANYKAEQIVVQREAQKQQRTVVDSHEDREEAAIEKYSDYKEVVHVEPKDGGPAISEAMAEVIMSSEIGPEIAYYLGKNVEESKRIWELKPLAQAAAIGKIEAALSAKPAVKPLSSAPDPIKPVSGGRATSPGYDPTDPRSLKAGTSAWIEARNKQIQNRK